MPYRKKSTKKSKKVTLVVKKFKREERPKTSVNMGLGFPKRMVVKHKYADTFTMTSSTGGITNYQFALNGMTTVDLTGTTHQPMYFDQLNAIYDEYTVVGCKMKVTFVPRESNTIPTVVCLWMNDDSTTTPTTIDYFAEQSKAKTFLVGSGGDDKKTLSLNYSTKKTFGGSILANTLLKGNVASNPSELSVGQISVQSADQLTTNVVTVMVQLEYVAVWTELKDIQGSS